MTAPSPSAPGVADESSDRPERHATPGRVPRTARSRWFEVLSATLIVLGAITTPISIVGAWARVELVDADRFVQTFGPLADDPAVQALLVDQVTAAVDEQLDIASLTDDLFDGIASLDLPPRAAAALELLRGPAAQGAQSLIDRTVERVVESDAFSDVWSTALRASHRAFAAAATGAGGGPVTVDAEGVVGLELGPIVEQVKQRLVDQGIGVAAAIPVVDRTIVIVQSDAIVTVQVVYGLAVAAGWWLPVITLILFVAGVLVARRRSTALLGAGLGLALGAGALVVALAVGDTLTVVAAGQLGISTAALTAVYVQVIGAMRQTAVVLTVVGVAIALLAWSRGRWRGAVATRRAVAGVTDGARRGLASRGVDTGTFGRWMDRNRTLVRVILVVVAIAWLWLLRPLSVGEIFLVVVVMLVVWWLCELVRPVGAEAEAGAGAGVDVDVDATVDAAAEDDGAGEAGEPVGATPRADA